MSTEEIDRQITKQVGKKPVPERQTTSDFNEARHDRMTMTSAGSYVHHLRFAPDR